METGQQMKQLGLDLVTSHNEEWAARAIEKLKYFCLARKTLGQPRFRFEEFRAASADVGLDQPKTSKAWGALPRIAVRLGIIEATGEYAKATSAATHAHPVAVWVAK